MPFYIYRCGACQKETEEFQSIHDDKLDQCEACGAMGLYTRVPQLPHTDMKEFHTPIAMHSIGLAHADEISEFQKRNPNATISTDVNDPHYGVPMARTRKEKLDILRTEGFIETK